MYSAFHILQKQVIPEMLTDIYGRVIPPGNVTEDGEVYWETVCKCRCDEDGVKEEKLADGTIVVPDYRVICDGNSPDVAVGDYVRCCRSDGSVRGQGKVLKTKTLNYLQYAEICLQD